MGVNMNVSHVVIAHFVASESAIVYSTGGGLNDAMDFVRSPNWAHIRREALKLLSMVSIGPCYGLAVVQLDPRKVVYEGEGEPDDGARPVPPDTIFRRAVEAALRNCWGKDPAPSEADIRAWLEKEWHTGNGAVNEVKKLRSELALAQTIVLNMAARLFGGD